MGLAWSNGPSGKADKSMIKQFLMRTGCGVFSNFQTVTPPSSSSFPPKHEPIEALGVKTHKVWWILSDWVAGCLTLKLVHAQLPAIRQLQFKFSCQSLAPPSALVSSQLYSSAFASLSNFSGRWFARRPHFSNQRKAVAFPFVHLSFRYEERRDELHGFSM